MNRENWIEIKNRYESNLFYGPTYLIIAFDILLMFCAWHLSFMGSFYFIMSIALLTVALVHLYLFSHEAAHSAVSSNASFNHLFGQFCGWAILMPFLPRQSSHLLHHTWTGHPVRDPANNRMIKRFSVMTPQQAQQLEFVWKIWFPAIIINDRIGLWMAPFQQRKSGLNSKRNSQEIRWVYIYAGSYVLFLTALYLFNVLGHFLSLYLPALVLLFLIEELVNLPHHAETPLLNAQDKALPYWEQHRVTHSCQNVPIWSRFFLLNFNLHIPHHIYPNAPWFILPQLEKEINAKISSNETTHTETVNELTWSLKNRKRPLLKIMGHYFDKIEQVQSAE